MHLHITHCGRIFLAPQTPAGPCYGSKNQTAKLTLLKITQQNNHLAFPLLRPQTGPGIRDKTIFPPKSITARRARQPICCVAVGEQIPMNQSPLRSKALESTSVLTRRLNPGTSFPAKRWPRLCLNGSHDREFTPSLIRQTISFQKDLIKPLPSRSYFSTGPLSESYKDKTAEEGPQILPKAFWGSGERAESHLWSKTSLQNPCNHLHPLPRLSPFGSCCPQSQCPLKLFSATKAKYP